MYFLFYLEFHYVKGKFLVTQNFLLYAAFVTFLERTPYTYLPQETFW